MNGTVAYSYVINKNNIFGHLVAPVHEILSLEKAESEEGEPFSTRIEKNALTLSLGNIYFMSGNTTSYTPLTSHAFLLNYPFQDDNDEGHTRYFFANLALKRYQNCLVAAKFLRENPFFDVLGRKSMENLDLDISLKAYQLSKNLAMVLTLEPLQH